MKLLSNEIYSFVEHLSRLKLANNAFNQYSTDIIINSIKRKNLYLYLQQMAALQPKVLLVGEAPGYRGCRLTGVPFTSEFILINGIEKLGLFGKARGYHITNEWKRTCKEQSATIVWDALAQLEQVPLLWNAFPFHPFQAGNEKSNRIPNKEELKLGQEILEEISLLFDIKRVIAVGNTAEAILKNMGIVSQKVRHPANGGKTKFINGLHSSFRVISFSLSPPRT